MTLVKICWNFYDTKVATGTMDGIIDTVSAMHPLLPLLALLKSHGKLILVGAPEKPLELPAFALLMGNELTISILCFSLIIYQNKI